MILAIDTDVLVSWVMKGAVHHDAVRGFLAREVQVQGTRLALAPQVMFEFIHVCSDPKRFNQPLSMEQALRTANQIWHSREVVPIIQGLSVLPRTIELLAVFSLGRKRILDTALAATLEAAGIRRLASLNSKDFAGFSFLEVVSPT